MVVVTSPKQQYHLALQAEQYCIVIYDEGLYIAKGLSTNIGLVSYASVQIFELWLHNRFRAILAKVVHLRSLTFAHLMLDEILTMLPGTQTLTADKTTLEVDPVGYSLFLQLRAVLPLVLGAVTFLRKARRKKTKVLRASGVGDHEDADSD
ncbi:hypothetical protein FOMPIDRAFT_82728 [Fomitopsis schrenkii]|uniref:Uncharacterized protein n=1 Tax=Fomitopsis schrenkii TaxID=2126942 RepID=S8DQM7_FOMSC|nr:hypothetical protein FOMPIDRAFT_82728 [Fomitopsis schrenkii]